MAQTPEQKAADSAVVEAVLAGDAAAYRSLVERYQRRIYAMVTGMVRDKEEARDLTQDAFIKAYKNLDRFRKDSSFYTWLYRIAMNVAIDHLRKHGKRKNVEFDEKIGTADGDGSLDDRHRIGDPAKELARKQLGDKIFDALDQLSPEHRQIVILREVDGLSYKEIADTLELAEGTVMSRLFYARRKLQGMLKEEIAR